MAALPEWRDRAVACSDPDCLDAAGNPSIAEPEQDSLYRYHACTVCGYAFGYERIQHELVAVDAGGTCAVGIPEDLRRAASAGMEGALAAQARREPPLLTIGRRPHDTAS